MKKILQKITYAKAVYGKEEIAAVNRILKDPLHLGAGAYIKKFEKAVAALFGKKHGIMTNSGSSANLLGIESLHLEPGSEVITPVLTFSTTIAPLLQKGLKPVFVDVMPGTFVIDAGKVEAAITEKTRALMVPLLLGNVPDMIKLRAIAKKHNLFFIEDSCDTVGAKFDGKPTGTYSDISTTSFYASHIITAAGSGGMVMAHDDARAHELLVKSCWGRDSTLFGVNEKSEDIKKRFAGKVEGEPYDAKFVFSQIGYNMQSGELNAAFGLEQLKRLKTFGAARKHNFKRLYKFFGTYPEWFTLPLSDKRVDTVWLAFPLTLKKNAPFSRMDITRHLEEHNIQTRPIFTGNILRQPGFHDLSKDTNPDQFPVADDVMQNGFLIGCHHGLTAKQLDYIEAVLKEFLKKYR